MVEIRSYIYFPIQVIKALACIRYGQLKSFYKQLGIINRNFKYLTINSFVLLYKSMVWSHLDYCSSIWVPYKKGDIEFKKGQQS